jgi:hypothetical protein
VWWTTVAMAFAVVALVPSWQTPATIAAPKSDARPVAQVRRASMTVAKTMVSDRKMFSEDDVATNSAAPVDEK